MAKSRWIELERRVVKEVGWVAARVVVEDEIGRIGREKERGKEIGKEIGKETEKETEKEIATETVTETELVEVAVPMFPLHLHHQRMVLQS